MPVHSFDSISPASVTCAGFCRACGREHALVAGPALAEARRLMDELARAGRIDLDAPEGEADPRFSLEYLYGPARGQMFGVMTWRDHEGREGVSRAFSCQYNGAWTVPGWVPPVVSPEAFSRVHDPVERRLTAMGRELAALDADDPRRAQLKRDRREMARENMRDLHALYHLSNFRGQTRPMAEAFAGPGGLPTGTGDCCAPKLLQFAALNGLVPTGLVEFFWGRANSSGTRSEGAFYAACAERCAPILGFMLCGLGEAGQDEAVEAGEALGSGASSEPGTLAGAGGVATVPENSEEDRS